jgi:hypothetical protein
VSIAALSQRFARPPVRPVRPPANLERTAKNLANQDGSPGSPGSPENNKEAERTERDEPLIPTQNVRDYRQRRTIQIKDSWRTSEPLKTLPETDKTDSEPAPAPANTDAKTAAHAYYNHLMAQRASGCGCVTNFGALVARLCPEGQRLRDRYTAAATGGH